MKNPCYTSIKFHLNLKEYEESNNYFHSYQVNKIEYFVELYFNLNLYLNLNINPYINRNLAKARFLGLVLAMSATKCDNNSVTKFM